MIPDSAVFVFLVGMQGTQDGIGEKILLLPTGRTMNGPVIRKKLCSQICEKFQQVTPRNTGVDMYRLVTDFFCTETLQITGNERLELPELADSCNITEELQFSFLIAEQIDVTT